MAKMEKMQRCVLIARYIQLIFGFLGTITLVIVAVQEEYYEIDFEGISAALGALVVLPGYVGMFHFYRRDDVHWHLVLSFDIFGAAASFISLVITLLFIPYGYCLWSETQCSVGSISAVLIGFTFASCILTIVQTIRLYKKGRLRRPPSIKSAKTHDWFHMEEQVIGTKDDSADAGTTVGEA